MKSASVARISFFGAQVKAGPYALAILSTAFGLGLRIAIDPWLGDQMPYVTFLVSVALTGLFAGVRPALLSTGLGAAVAYFCFVPPRYHWGFAGMSDAVGFGAYLAAALGIVALTRAANEAHKKAESTLQERINAERKLSDAQKLFQLFIDNKPYATYLRDEAGQYVYANREANRLFGIAAGAAPKADETVRVLEEQDRRVLASGRSLQLTLQMTLLGEEYYFLTNKFLFVDQQGRRFVGSLSIDVTSNLRAEQAMLEAERLAGASQMVAMVAHEVNNPLAAVTSSMFLLGREELPDRSRELVGIAQKELSRLAHITRLALGFYQEAEKPEVVRPCELLGDVLDRVAGQFSAKQVQIDRDFRWDDVFVAGAGHLRQLLENVIINSFESRAGRIHVRVERGTNWRMPRRLGIRISVMDDGCGIEPQQRKHVFEPFFSSKIRKGAGLGLWLSKAIIIRNGGTIALRSSNNPARHGTCVSLFLPAHLLAMPGKGLQIGDLQMRLQ